MFFLTFTLLVMLMGLGFSIYYDEIPVPEPLEEVVNSALHEHGLDLQYKKITIDLRANLLIEDATLSFTKSEGPAVRVDSIYLDINYPALLLGKIPLDRLTISNGSVYSPGIVSRSGTSDRVLESINLSLTKKWNTWNLLFFNARLQNLNISASGNLSALAAKFLSPKEEDRDPPNLYPEYLRLMKVVSDQSKYLQSLENPMLELEFQSPSMLISEVNFHMQSDSFIWEGLPKISVVRIQATAQILPDLSLTNPIHTSIQRIESEEMELKIHGLNIRAGDARNIPDWKDIFPLRIETSTSRILVKGTAVDHVLFKGQLLSRDHAEGELVASIFNRPIQANLIGNWKEQTASGQLKGSLNLEPLIARPEFDHLWKLRWSRQNKPIFLDMEFDYPGELENTTASFRVETRDIEIIKTPFQWARVRGTLHGTRVNIPYLVGGGYENDLFCTFRQDLRSYPFYRFTMKGLFRPHDIDIWWRDWWKKTFDYLDIKGDLPYMDLSIRNAFSYKKQLTLFGYAKGENINLKGMHFDEAEVKMFVRPNYVDALEFKLVRPEGEASGEFQRQLVESRLKNVIVDLTSNIDLEPSLQLFGETGMRILEPYTWEGNPTIALDGEFNFENDSNWQDLEFTIDTDEPMTLYKFPFDSLHVEGHYDYGDVLLHEVEFDFAGGKGYGEASYLRQEDQSFLLFDLNIDDADLEETLKRIAIVKKPVAQEEEVDQSKKAGEPIEGKLKLHASGISPAGYGLDRVMAKGDIQVTEGNLAQIPLFGPLSSLIPFTKLRLNTAESFFAWDDGKMTFPNLRMKSNTARLDAVGDYYTKTSNLDFQVKIFLLREAEIPLVSSIIMPLFDPFSTIGSVNLKGTLAKPEWRFALSPFNLFDQKPVNESPQDLDSLLDFEFRK